MTILVLISAILLLGFIAFSVHTFGLLPSYSAYAAKWEGALTHTPANLWSIITIVSALLIVPKCLALGEESLLQFLGFCVPAYLAGVGSTPGWESNKKEHTLHTVLAVICAISALLWISLVCGMFQVILAVSALVMMCAVFSGRFDAFILWGELVMFISTYVTLLTL